MRRRIGPALLAVTVLAGVVTGVSAASPAAAADGAQLDGVTFATATQDVTLKAGSLSVQVKARNAQYVYASMASKGWVDGSVGPRRVEGGLMQRTAGTAADGTYSATIALPVGTSSSWGLELALFSSGTSEGDRWDGDRLVAAGFPGYVATRTTTAPPAPANLKAVTSFQVTEYYQVLGVLTATWTQPAGKPQPADWLFTTSGQCAATLYSQTLLPTAKGYHFGSQGTGFCTISVRARNAAGTSPAVTARGFFF